MITITTPLSTGLRELADLLDQHPELPTPKIHASWHRADDETVAAVVVATPDVTWTAKAGPSNEWIDGRTKTGIELTVFAAPPPQALDTSRLKAILTEAAAVAS